jgi:hypothetical protein
MTNVTSYDVLVKGVMLFLMGFAFNFWEETIAKPWTQLNKVHDEFTGGDAQEQSF